MMDHDLSEHDDLDPMFIMRISSAYWESSVLHVANKLNIFTKLSEDPMSVDKLAPLCVANERGLEMILISCVGMGLLEKKEGKYFNTPSAETFLVQGSPRYQGGIVSMFADWVLPWSNLGDAVAHGGPVVEKQHEHGEQATRTYIMGMLYRGIPQAELLSTEVPLPGKKKLLDVGGGPGIFSIILCQKNPGLSADVLDLTQTLTITNEVIKNWHAEDQVSTIDGSYYDDDYGRGYDVVLTSSMISQEGPSMIKHILQQSYNALDSGGLILIQEQFLNTEKSGPLLPALIGLNQLIHTPSGQAYSAQEVVDMAEAVGFTDLSFRALPDPSPFTLISAVKP